MNQKKFKKDLGIYVDLDCLLDTRMGTLVKHYPELAASLLEDDNYYLRVEESFRDIPTTQFEELYSTRDKETLQLSRLTRIPEMLANMVMDFSSSMVNHPNYENIILYVNIHPYVLDDNEKDTLIKIIEGFTHAIPKVKIIDKSLESLSCMWVNLFVDHLFIYHYDKWLNARGKELNHRGLPYTSLYCPMLYFGHVPTKEDKRNIEELLGDEVSDHFTLVAELYKTIIQFNFIPVDMFCILNDIAEKYSQSTAPE